MKYLAILMVGSLLTACGGRNKGPSYFAQGQRITELARNGNPASGEHSRLRAGPTQTAHLTLAGRKGEGHL